MLKKTTLIVFSLLIVACGSIPELTEEGASVTLMSSSQSKAKNCRYVGEVVGYGNSEDEAINDIRHEAKTEFKATHVLIKNLKTFVQDERLSNYHRTPELKAPKATRAYYYADPFDQMAKGNAYQCAKAN